MPAPRAGASTDVLVAVAVKGREARLAGSRVTGSRLTGSRLAGSRLAGSRLTGSRVAGSRTRPAEARTDSGCPATPDTTRSTGIRPSAPRPASDARSPAVVTRGSELIQTKSPTWT